MMSRHGFSTVLPPNCFGLYWVGYLILVAFQNKFCTFSLFWSFFSSGPGFNFVEERTFSAVTILTKKNIFQSKSPQLC